MTCSVQIYNAGCVTGYGLDKGDLAKGVFLGETAVNEITTFEAHEDSPGLGALVPQFKVSQYFPSIKSYIDRSSALSLLAAADALRFKPDSRDAFEKVGLVFASRYACLETMRMYANAGLDRGWRFAPPFLFIHSYPNTPAALMHIELGLKGFSEVFSGFSASGLSAICDAVRAIGSGQAGPVLAGGAEALSELRYNYLYEKGELGTFDEPASTQPGEAAAFLLLAPEDGLPDGVLPGARPLAEISLHDATDHPKPDVCFCRSCTNCQKTGRAFDLGKFTGDCDAANVPLAVTAFLFSEQFADDELAVISDHNNSGTVLLVRKRR
ncbi:MAG: beta-ketoacyl synthase N-terminal-like domain-containing protein [Planctomycetota bacterium]|nr:beta-ketoacyl synthase N-terminal-like domain-containing protein [Planctomycetota bacterium]